jgi:hypothetical protein
MRTPSKLVLATTLVVLAGSCAGVRQNGGQVTSHAESFNLLGLQIPGRDYERAFDALPAGAEIQSVRSNPSDWTSLFGVLNRILGVSYTEVSASSDEPAAASE